MSAWRFRYGMDEDDVRHAAFPAVAQAAKRFEPRRGIAFQTFAYSHILGGLYQATKTKSIAESSPLYEEEIEKRAKRVREEESFCGPSFWDLFDLDDTPRPGGSALGRRLIQLNPDELDRLAEWLDENRAQAAELYGQAHAVTVHAIVATVAWLTRMPPHEKLVDDSPYRIGMKAVAFPPHGERVDIAKPFEAAHLRRRGYSLREIAARLGVGKDKVARMLERYQAHASTKFTPGEMLGVAAGMKRGRRKKRN